MPSFRLAAPSSGHPHVTPAPRVDDSLFRSVFDNTLEAIVVWDAAGRVLEANAEACYLFDRSLEQMRASVASDLVDTTDPRIATTLAVAESSGRFAGLLPLLRRDGSCFHADVSATRFTDAAGHVRICTFVRDIAARDLAERALLASENRYRSVIETSGTVLIGVGADGTVFEWNREAEHVYGCARSDALGRDFYDLFVPEARRADARAGIATVLAGTASRNVEYPVRSRDGTERVLIWNVARLVGVRGEALGVIASGQDITELRRLDGERRALEAKVQHAQKLESLGVLAGGIAHDFNNLLVGILGNASLALMDIPEDSPLREVVADIETTALRAADLTKQMLAYSGKGRFIVHPVDVNALVKEMAQLLQTVISKRAALRFDFAPDLPPVEADATQLRQIVMNLITNASDALGGEDGVITLRTGVRHTTREYLTSSYVDDELPVGPYAFIEVEDSGCGMDAETQERIFDPFFSTKFTGRGLGLAATLGIVRGHRGMIKVASVPTRGTTFTVLLPCTSSASLPDQAPEPRRDRFRGSGAVLVVDDDETVRSVARQMLERSGFTVLTARDGSEGLDVYTSSLDPIALVLLDLTMPTLGGEEAFRALRRARPDVRIVLMSGYSSHELAARYGAEGLAGFIQKPFRLEELEECLTRVLGESAA
jgi:two-component system, cell cycle sensor histidine kinase and response regulator CckA